MCAANPYPDVRRRYWNAYMLFYQKISDQNSPVLPKKSRVSIMRQEAEDLSLSVDLFIISFICQQIKNERFFFFFFCLAVLKRFSYQYCVYSAGLRHLLLMYPHNPLPVPPGPTTTVSPCSPAWSVRERRRGFL